MQNAIRHNLSPGTATIATSHDPVRGTVTLRVENTGAVYEPEQAARLSEPFLRGTGRATRPDQARSYGIGLALVSRITEVHHCTLVIAARDTGGLDIVVVLPDSTSTRARAASGHPTR